jgi:hypothetical protein
MYHTNAGGTGKSRVRKERLANVFLRRVAALLFKSACNKYALLIGATAYEKSDCTEAVSVVYTQNVFHPWL